MFARLHFKVLPDRLLISLFSPLLFFFTDAQAVRPFITDDARVVGLRLAQCETWLRLDKHAWQQWAMFAYGPTKKWELALGFVHGVEIPGTEKKQYSYAIPLIQAKYLIREYVPNKTPGIAIAAGSFLPGGRGVFKAPGYGAFGYVSLTQCFGKEEQVLIHANIGSSYLQYSSNDYHAVMTWGIGTQIRTLGGLHLIGELFSGDPYVPGSGLAYQTGFRHFVSNFVQLDLTAGQGISGDNKLAFWYGGGIRVVTDLFLKRHNAKNIDTGAVL